MKNHLYHFAISLILSFAFLGCGNDDNDRAERDERTYLRFFNGVSDVDRVDLILDGERLYDRLPYLADTGYFRTGSESRELSVVVSGTFTPLFSSTTTLNDDADQTLLVFGTSEAPRGVIVNDDNTQPGEDVSKLRIISLAQGVRAIDVYVISAGVSIDDVGPTASGLSLGGISPYIVSDDGQYDVVVTERGSKVPIASRRQTFSGNEVSSILVADAADAGGAARVLVLRDR